MASYLRPRRGKKATAIAQLTASAPLKRGEVFFEVPNGGTGTGAGKIKMGDGSTAYESLPYFLEPFDPNSATVGFTDASAAESDPYATNATHANAIVPTANLKTIFTNLKQLLLNYNSQLTTLNNDLGTLSFSQNEEGAWGYKVGGADTVIPFKSGDDMIVYRQTYTGLSGHTNLENKGNISLTVKTFPYSDTQKIRVYGTDSPTNLSHVNNVTLLGEFTLSKSKIDIEQILDTGTEFQYIVIYSVYHSGWSAGDGAICEVKIY